MLEEYLEQIEESGYCLPVVELKFLEEEAKPWESRLGGCPYLRAAGDYPIGENGKPMLFLAQINLREVPRLPVLPDHGLLQFFVNYDEWVGMQGPCQVRYIEEVTEAEEELVAAHPFADEAYRKALPFEQPCRITFGGVALTQEQDENSRIGGYPYFPQEGELEPDEEFLLLQLADDENICFGDCGACRFIISLEDLVNLDFSDVGYSWDCC